MWWTGLRETMWPSTRTSLSTCVTNSTSDTHSLNFLSSVNDSNTTFQIASRFCQLTNSCPRSSSFQWSVVVPSYKSHYHQGSAESIVPPPLCSHSTSPWWEVSLNIGTWEYNTEDLHIKNCWDETSTLFGTLSVWLICHSLLFNGDVNVSSFSLCGKFFMAKPATTSTSSLSSGQDSETQQSFPPRVDLA